jgi:hypothetical protein
VSATLTQARDEIHGQFRTAWIAAGYGTSVPVIYRDAPGLSPPTSGSWARVTVQHQEGFQATLGGTDGTSRYRRLGVVTVQIFTDYGEGNVDGDTLATVAKNAFEGAVTSPGGVIFRNVRTPEIGQSGQWFQTNVLADFEYDEVR